MISDHYAHFMIVYKNLQTLRNLPNLNDFSAIIVKVSRDRRKNFGSEDYQMFYVCILNVFDGAHIHERKLTPMQDFRCLVWICPNIFYLIYTKRVAQIQDLASMIWQLSQFIADQGLDLVIIQLLEPKTATGTISTIPQFLWQIPKQSSTARHTFFSTSNGNSDFLQ